jgi:xylan 1,4-beta-xylosidase
LKVKPDNWYNWHARNPNPQRCIMLRNHVTQWLLLLALLSRGQIASAEEGKPVAGEPIPVHIHVSAAQTKGELKPVWRFFGADEPNYAYMKDGQKLIGELGEMRPNEVYFRAHNLLTTGDGTPALKWGSTNAYREDADGKPLYDWTILDRIFDTYRQRGVRPYVEIGFMPEALSTHPQPYQHKWSPQNSSSTIFTGWAYPPTDYEKWGELVYQWTKHCVEKYGKEEVEHWYWEVWNEANIRYWNGTQTDFQKLHDYAIAGVRRALPTAKVGGPDKAGSGDAWFRTFLEHCVRGTNFVTGETGTPTDFVSFHAKGNPQLFEGHEQMGIATQLRGIESGFATVASFPELKDKPIVIGESDPDSCAACLGTRFGYRNTTMFSSYTAECIARELELADQHGVNFEGALTWAFEFEGQPLFNGYRKLAAGGIDLPVLNVFRMLSKMSGQRVAAESDAAIPLASIVRSGVRDKPDIAALASFDSKAKKLCVMVWYYHDDDLPGADAKVELSVDDMPAALGEAKLTHYRIDADHSNAYTVWQEMGSPAEPAPDQYQTLEQSGRLATIEAPASASTDSGGTSLQFNLPRQGISLIVLQWPQGEAGTK